MSTQSNTLMDKKHACMHVHLVDVLQFMPLGYKQHIQSVAERLLVQLPRMSLPCVALEAA